MIRPLNARELWLTIIVGGVLFVGGNLLAIESFWKSKDSLRRDIGMKTRQLRSMHELIADRSFWEQRDQWLQSTQPKLTSSDAAGVELLERIRSLAQKHSVLLENPAIRSAERQSTHITVAIEIETKSAWTPLVTFLHELQSPSQFVAVENVNLKIDPADPTQLRGRFKIARWYAP
jgi:hypothetical protein